MRRQRGFTLIEVIMTTVLMGVIASFLGFLLSTGTKSFVTVRNTTTASLNAQVALTRLSLEFKELASLTLANVSDDVSIRFTDTAGATRMVVYDQDAGTISLGNGATNYTLIGGIAPGSVTLRATWANMDSTAANEVQSVTFGFTLTSTGTAFSDVVYPRGQNLTMGHFPGGPA